MIGTRGVVTGVVAPPSMDPRTTVLEMFNVAIRTDDTNGLKDFSVAGFIFIYVQKYFSNPLREAIALYGSATSALFTCIQGQI